MSATGGFFMVAVGGAAFLGAPFVPDPRAQVPMRVGGGLLAAIGAWQLYKAFQESGGIGGALLGSVLGNILQPGDKLKSSEQVPPPVGAPPGAKPDEAPTQGVALGGKAVKVTGQIIDPANGGTVSRHILRSTYPVTIELVNLTAEARSVLVEVRATYFEVVGGTREELHSIGNVQLAPNAVQRVEAELDSGNVHTGLFEAGSAHVAAGLHLNNKLVQGTSFYMK